jgi:hypothetical protein
VAPGSVTSVGFLLAEKMPGPFALEVAWIKVLRCPIAGSVRVGRQSERRPRTRIVLHCDVTNQVRPGSE